METAIGRKFRPKKLSKYPRIVNVTSTERRFKQKYELMQLNKIMHERNYNLRSYGSNSNVGGKAVSSAAGGLGVKSQSISRLANTGSGYLDLNRVNTYQS
jgi:hypothetical protein